MSKQSTILILIVCIAGWYIYTIYTQNLWIETPATIIKTEKKARGSGGSKNWYCFTVQYQYQDKNYTKRECNRGMGGPQSGDQVKIFVNPGHPEQISIPIR